MANIKPTVPLYHNASSTMPILIIQRMLLNIKIGNEKRELDEEMWIFFFPHFFWKKNENCVQGHIFFTFTELMVGL